MKTLKFGIVSLFSLFLFFACGEVEYFQPVGGTQNPPGEEIVTQTIEMNDVPLFYLDFEVQDNGTMNAVGDPVPLLGDLRATQEVPWYYFQNDTTLSWPADAIMNELNNYLMGVITNIQYTTYITHVKVRAIGLYNPNLDGQVTNFFIKMWSDGYGMLETGNRPGGNTLSYTLKTDYEAYVHSDDANNRGIVEIFDRSMLAFVANRKVHYSASGLTTIDPGNKLRYYYTVNMLVSFSMPLRQ